MRSFSKGQAGTTKTIVKYSYFARNFKISFAYPRSDLYQTCDRLKNVIVAELNQEEKKKFELERDLHIRIAIYFIDI